VRHNQPSNLNNPDQYDELERASVLDDEPEASPEERTRPTRLRRHPSLFVRVPISWLTKPPREQPFQPRDRLFLYLLFRSHWGQRPVVVTGAFAAEVGISRQSKTQILYGLERTGWIRIERRGRQAPIVRVMVLSD
jgi:hypothetical protein